VYEIQYFIYGKLQTSWTTGFRYWHLQSLCDKDAGYFSRILIFWKEYGASGLSSASPIVNPGLGTTFTLHKSQVHYSGDRQWWDYRSLVPAPLPAGTGQGCQTGLFRPNFRNLASFQIGWPKHFIWPFGIISSLLSLKNLSGLLAFLRWEIYLWRNILLFRFFRQHICKTFLINAILD